MRACSLQAPQNQKPPSNIKITDFFNELQVLKIQTYERDTNAYPILPNRSLEGERDGGVLMLSSGWREAAHTRQDALLCSDNTLSIPSGKYSCRAGYNTQSNNYND